MFSHIMVGTNDPERSRDFYNRLFEKEGGTDDKGRTAWRNKGSVFMISRPIDGEPATHANGGTIGFNFDSPEEALPVALPPELERKIMAENARAFYRL